LGVEKRTKMIGLLITLFAFALRILYYNDAPLFRTDELGENYSAMKFIEQTKVHYVGPVYGQITGILFWICGRVIPTARLFSVVLGTITVVITFFLVNEANGERAGLATALLLMTSPFHVFGTSHMAWSPSLTPLLTLLGIYFLYKSVQSNRKWWLFASALAFGLGRQSHPVAIIHLLGAIMFLLLFKRKWIGVRYFSFFILFVVIGYSNLLYSNYQNKLIPLTESTSFAEPLLYYLKHSPKDAQELYVDRVWMFFVNLFKILSGMKTYHWKKMFGRPLFYVFPIISLVSLGHALRNRSVFKDLCISIIAVLVVMFPIFVNTTVHYRYPSPFGPHYYQSFLLVVYSLWGNFLSEISNNRTNLDIGRPISFIDRFIKISMVDLFFLLLYSCSYLETRF